MSYKKIIAFVLALSVAAMSLAGCSKSDSSASGEESSSKVQISSKETDIDDTISQLDLDFTANDLDVGYDESSATKIIYEADTPTVSGEGAESSGRDVVISAAGCYIISGVVSDGQIRIEAGKEDKIQLVLDNASIACKTGAPIYIKSAEKVFITLAEGTTSTLTDTADEYEADGDISPDAVIFSKEDLTVNGSGKLVIEASYKHGIVSKDDLVIAGGDIEITAAKTAIEGKDSVKIADGTFKINAGTNGIVSSNAEDESKGYVYIEDGSFEITAGTDGIQAETILTVTAGKLDITTGGGSANAQQKKNNDFGGNGGMGGFDKGEIRQGGDMQPPDGEMPQMQDGQTPPEMPDGQMPQGDMQMPQGGFGGRGERGGRGDLATGGNTQSTANEGTALTDMLETTSNDTAAAEWTDADNTGSDSMKGLKAGKGIAISGGSFKIDSADDTLHSNGSVVISGGGLELSSGDDGIHADEIIEVSSGTVNITKAYEGVEAKYINVSGGDIKVNASDDGFNASDGSGENFGGMGGRGTQQQTTQSGDTPYLKILGGTVYVNANGDGLDSNGSVFIEGGDITVYGPTNGGNGALDKGDGNYSLKATGGTLAAFGATGMEEGFTEDSTQAGFLHNFANTVAAGTEVTVKDSSGSVIASYTPAKSWQSMVFTSGALKQGETYTVTAGNQSDTVTLESINTSNSTGGSFGGGGMGGGRMRGNN